MRVRGIISFSCARSNIGSTDSEMKTMVSDMKTMVKQLSTCDNTHFTKNLFSLLITYNFIKKNHHHDSICNILTTYNLNFLNLYNGPLTSNNDLQCTIKINYNVTF